MFFHLFKLSQQQKVLFIYSIQWLVHCIVKDITPQNKKLAVKYAYSRVSSKRYRMALTHQHIKGVTIGNKINS